MAAPPVVVGGVQDSVARPSPAETRNDGRPGGMALTALVNFVADLPEPWLSR